MAVRLVEGHQTDVLSSAENIPPAGYTIWITKEPEYARCQRSTLLGVVNHDLLGMNGLTAQCLLQFLQMREQDGNVVSTLNTKHLAKIIGHSFTASSFVAADDTAFTYMILTRGYESL